LRKINPGLVTLETTAYGATGPKSHAPGFDMVMQAHCGLEHRAGGVGNPPLCCRAPLVDFATGAVGAIGLLVGLYERMKTGWGVAVQTSLLNVGTHMMSELIRAPDGAFIGAPALDQTQTGIHPAESLYQTSDGWIAIAARSAEMAGALADLLGLALPAKRAAWRAAERERIAVRIASWSTAALLSELESAGVWAEACVRDAWEKSPQDEGVVRTMHDELYGEVIHCIGPLVQFSRSRTVPAARLSTQPGQDGKAILAELSRSQ
jgi:crotonobetainyl-CoA:carnitine CoA-transferase CaiB-like acyl-CoA transferase